MRKFIKLIQNKLFEKEEICHAIGTKSYFVN